MTATVNRMGMVKQNNSSFWSLVSFIVQIVYLVIIESQRLFTVLWKTYPVGGDYLVGSDYGDQPLTGFTFLFRGGEV